MKKKLILSGEEYHNNKNKFKQLLVSYDIKWTGNWAKGEFTWDNKTDNILVKVDYERDPETERTTSATMIINYDNEVIIKPFLEQLQELFHKPIMDMDEVKKEPVDKLPEYDRSWKLRIENAKKDGAPDGYVRQMENEWSEGRKKFIVNVVRGVGVENDR